MDNSDQSRRLRRVDVTVTSRQAPSRIAREVVNQIKKLSAQPQPGDTVDPRTLPVGAVFRHVGWDCQFRVTESGLTAESFDGRFSGLNIGSASAILLSLPNPRRPPCDACGEESCLSNTGAALCMFDARPARLCRNCWHDVASIDFDVVEKNVRARRAAQASPERPIVEPMSAASENPPRKSTVPSSLPTYDQIAGWLGAEWVVRDADWQPFSFAMKWAERDPGVAPFPWWRAAGGQWRCYLRHTSGQRVEITAPREPPGGSGWCIWFGLIRNQSRITGARSEEYQRYQAHVRWLDPDTKTSTGSDADASEFIRAEAEGPSSEPVAPPRCSSCNQPFWAGRPSCFYDTLCGDCFRSGCVDEADHLTNDLDTRIAEVAEPEVRIENMPGAWATACDEGLS